jgi:hypothetical protein
VPSWKLDTDAPVGRNEYLGRRLFATSPRLVGGKNQKDNDSFHYTHFLNRPGDTKTSFDRLGRSSVERAVKRELCPIAATAGQRFNPARDFRGWAVIQVQKLCDPPARAPDSYRQLKVVPSPLTSSDGEENRFHAEIDTPSGVTPYDIAHHYYTMFSDYGKFEPPLGSTSTVASRPKSVLAMPVGLIRKFASWLAHRLRARW